jgi:hypothetical protein
MGQQIQIKRERIAYLIGPVDAVEVYEKWKSDRRLDYFGHSHMLDFFQMCEARASDCYVITTLADKFARFERDGVIIENWPLPAGFHGALYHAANIWWLLRLLPRIIRFSPDTLIVTAGGNHWFLLSVLRLWNITIIPVLTCTLWLGSSR